ncbi:hypothetical protein ACFU98_35120 [Streptomyces sp. NPDC057575]|uniref:hypothetical protein n=1 Tax=unclassified Streptomyces TaxID=2593676 RepID=UPI003682433B
MGYELRRDLREALGPAITGLQRAVALEIADDANDDTRESYVELPDLARWTGAGSVDVVRNALKRLAAAGWEFRVPIGKGKDGRVLYAVPGRRVTFLVPPFEGGAGAPSEGARATPKGEPGLPQGGAGARSEGAGARSEGAGAPPFSSTPQSPQEEEDSSAPVAADPISDEQLREFGNFWLLYPKSIDRPATLAAWKAAVANGANPEKITAAAVAYAKERAGEDRKFTKYSANWLRDARYDDAVAPEPTGKPNLRAVDGKGYRPFQAQTKPDAYANGF